MRRTKVMALAMLLALSALVAACGGGAKSSNSAAGPTPTATASGSCAGAQSSSLAKFKFVSHAAIAFGAFHRYIYKPYQAGAFKAGAPGRTKALAKAGASALVVAHEIKAAKDAAAKDRTLCRLVGPLDSLSGVLTAIAPSLTSGTFDPSKVLDLNKRIEQFKRDSGSSGVQIPER